jgi:uncharacterized iron-regulated membrane protein
MKPLVFRVIRTFHAWLGVTLALLLLISSCTGSVLVWKNQIVSLSLPAPDIEFEPTPQNLAPLAEAIEDRYDNTEIGQIAFPTSSFPYAKVSLADTRYAYFDTEGNLLDEWTQNERWEEWLYDLHHRLLLENLGLTIVGLMGIAAMTLLIAGVITFWPLRSGFKQGILLSGSARLALLRTHRNLGIIEALPLLLTLVTGVILAFPDQVETLMLDPFRGEDYSMDFTDDIDDISGEHTGDWLPAMERALAVFPDSQIRTAQVPSIFSPYRILGMQQKGALNPTGMSKVYIYAEQGWMEFRIDAQNQHLSERLYNTAYPLHTGKMDSLVFKLVLTLSGMVVAVLSSLGLISFIKKYLKTR